jgi:hypothetical protein
MPSIPLPVEPRKGDHSRLWGAFIGVTPCDQQVLRAAAGPGNPQRPRLPHRWNHGPQARAGNRIFTPHAAATSSMLLP